MAELKAETTVGGSLVWTQGNFPLFPTGNTLVYKTYKVYSEYDKPQAVDNDFVSKANGGNFLGNLGVPAVGVSGTTGDGKGLSLYAGPVTGEPGYGIHFSQTSTFGGHGSNNQGWATYFVHKDNAYPWIFRSKSGSSVINVASISPTGVWQGPDVIIQNATPTNAAHATRKDYVDGQINTVTNNANSRVLRAGDTMTGNLTAPNVISSNPASQPAHLTRLDQVVTKGTTLDYGTF